MKRSKRRVTQKKGTKNQWKHAKNDEKLQSRCNFSLWTQQNCFQSKNLQLEIAPPQKASTFVNIYKH